MLSNTEKERLAVNAINNVSAKPGSFLTADIPVGDKGVSFDGTISVFRDRSEKKESLVGILPVQVKGTEVEDFTEGTRTFPLELAHYNNYLNRDGVVLFVVEINSNGDTIIFYRSLLGLELANIIKLYGHQKTRAVELRPLEETTLVAVCNKFLSEVTHQPRTLVMNNPFAPGDFNKYLFSSLTFNSTHPNSNSIFEHDFNLYGVLNETRFPLQIGRIASLATSSRMTSFKVSDKVFDLNVIHTFDKQKTKMEIEGFFDIIIDEESKEFKINFKGFHSLSSQIKSVPFVIELISGKEITFLNSTITMNKDAEQLEGMLESLLQHQKDLQDFLSAFKYFGIHEDVVFLESEGAEVYLMLFSLVQSYIQNKLVGFKPKEPKEACILNILVGDRSVVVFYNPHSSQKLINAFSEKMLECNIYIRSDEEDKTIQHSIFLMLDESSLANSVNLDPEIIKASFDRVNLFDDPESNEWSNQFCLNCIKAFDQSRKTELLHIANYIYDKYEPISDVDFPSILRNAIIRINQLQIQKRLNNELNKSEFIELLELKKNATKNENNELLFCINVLLNNKLEAEMTFNELPIESQISFGEMPIFNLYIDL